MRLSLAKMGLESAFVAGMAPTLGGVSGGVVVGQVVNNEKSLAVPALVGGSSAALGGLALLGNAVRTARPGSSLAPLAVGAGLLSLGGFTAISGLAALTGANEAGGH